jgi:hypothetical protein
MLGIILLKYLLRAGGGAGRPIAAFIELGAACVNPEGEVCEIVDID